MAMFEEQAVTRPSFSGLWTLAMEHRDDGLAGQVTVLDRADHL